MADDRLYFMLFVTLFEAHKERPLKKWSLLIFIRTRQIDRTNVLRLYHKPLEIIEDTK